MKQNDILSKEEFSNYYNPILKSYSDSFKTMVKPLDSINEFIYGNNDFKTVDKITLLAESSTDKYFNSLIFRTLGVREIIHCRESKEKLNILSTWNLITRSIRIIPTDFTISSIGSQGFLSIPIYKMDTSLQAFDFIRLHIWDDSINKYIDLKKCNNFSIHSHSFFAKSWIITGKIKNDRYDFLTNSLNSTHSFFEVVYNNSINEVNQHSSKAINKNINTELLKISEEIHFKNGYYEISPSSLHRSGHLNSPLASATFFSFTGKDGLGESFVIGPKDITQSEVNRKRSISPIYLLNKIDKQL